MTTASRWAARLHSTFNPSWLPGLLLAICLVHPAAADEAKAKPEPKDLVLKGDAVCTECHDETSSYPVLTIGKTKHGTIADGRNPTCITCHGASENHIKNKKEEGQKGRPKPDITYGGQYLKVPVDEQVERYFGRLGRGTTTPVADRNATCLSCHNGGKRMHWGGSTHESRGIACTNCHQIHTAHDRVRDKLSQTELCFTCHKEKRAEVNRPSHHPLLEGKMACSDCHNIHGSAGPRQLIKDNVNDTCFTCHMEKRGPFVHTHEPVQEDCSICHNPHGTTADSLLKMRPPMLCHQCHTPHGPNSLVLRGQPGASATSGKSNVNYTQARGCLNCHTEVHGSNNPTFTNPTPQFMIR